MKKVQVGARVNAEDAEFLNLLEINGATTPSDKLRAIIEEARLRRESTADYTGAYRFIQEQVTPLTERIKKIEFEQDVHSTVLTRIYEWMADFYAFCLCSLEEEAMSEEELKKYEKGVVDRIARLVDGLLQQEISSQQTSYDPAVFRNHVASFGKIIKMIENSSTQKEG